MRGQSRVGFSKASMDWLKVHVLSPVSYVHNPILERRLGGLLLVLLMTALHGSLLFGQTLPPANLQVGHVTWTFKDGAPENISCRGTSR